MFGVVPKPLWQRKAPADEANRIQLDTNCLLIEGPEGLLLCDTGFGNKLSKKELDHLEAGGQNSLVDNLALLLLSPGEISHVLFSHLHFDHAGGATYRNESGELRPTFPNAVHVFQERELADAIGEAPELTGNYHSGEIRQLQQQANCSMVSGDRELLPGIHLLQTGGHTFGHQVIEVRTADATGVYMGDLCPTSAHLNAFWTMSYDAYQLEVRRKKLEMLKEIADRGKIIFFDHDPEIRAATIRAKNETSFEIDQVFQLD